MTNSPDNKNPFLGTVKKAQKKTAPATMPSVPTPASSEAQPRSSKTKAVHVQISADKMVWVKELAEKKLLDAAHSV